MVLENSGRIDPENIDDYLANDGYQALTTAVTSMQPARSSTKWYAAACAGVVAPDTRPG